MQIFQALHPEDTTTTADNLQNVTLRNVLVDGQYNDLGFEANGKTIILIEAQTQWSDNIILRIMLYYLRTLDEKQERDKNSLFNRKPLPLLKPEFYIVYTGDKTDISTQFCPRNAQGGRTPFQDYAVHQAVGQGIE